jgi:hypothetical protein
MLTNVSPAPVVYDLMSVKLPITDWRTAFDLCADRKALKVLMHP